MNTIEIIKVNDDAIIPSKKVHNSDIGYDITAISIWKVLSEYTTIYDTGIAVKPPEGMYTEILPRSSLSKTGYVLANSVGIIDPDYTGTLKIAVTKVDPSCPNLELPFCKFQLVLRKAHYYEFKQVTKFKEEKSERKRGSGCFGSTD